MGKDIKTSVLQFWQKNLDEGKARQFDDQTGYWVPLTALGSHLRNEGFELTVKLKPLVEGIGGFEILEVPTTNGKAYWIKPGEGTPPAQATAPKTEKQPATAEATAAEAPKIGKIPLENNPVEKTDDHEADKLRAIAKIEEMSANPEGYTKADAKAWFKLYTNSHAAQKAEALKKHMAEGGNEEDFTFPNDPRFLPLREKYTQVYSMLPAAPATPEKQQAPAVSQKTVKELRNLFENLRGEKDYVHLKDLHKAALAAGVVPAGTNQSRFLNGYLLASGAFDNGLEWNKIQLHFDPYQDMIDYINFFAAMGPERPLQKAMQKLKELALPERWDYRRTDGTSLLESYFKHTLYRLRIEDKIVEKTDKDGVRWAAFNTGLVDKLYRPICCLLTGNTKGKQPWQFVAFAVHAHDRHGNLLMNKIGDVPPAASYFQGPDLLFDTSKEIYPDYIHIIVENVDRLPEEQIRAAFMFNGSEMPQKADGESKEAYYKRLGQAIHDNDMVLNQLRARIDSAIELAVKRTSWNYKTAIPMYYPRGNSIGLFLPLAIRNQNTVDCALVVAKTEQGHYAGKTIYRLDWAYECSRLVCRPDSDWLSVDLLSARQPQ